MRKSIFLLLAMVLMLSGCGILYPPPTKTTTLENGTVITEPSTDASGFFESKNLSNFYAMEMNRVDKHSAVVEKKIAALQEAGRTMLNEAQTQGEKLLASVVTSLQVNAIPVDPPPSGIKPPVILADFANVNLVPILTLAGNLWLRSGDMSNSGNDSPSLNNSGNGNTINYMSPNSFNPSYNLSGEASGTFNIGTYNITDSSSTDKSTTTSLF